MQNFYKLEKAFKMQDQTAVKEFFENLFLKFQKRQYIKTYEAEFYCRHIALASIQGTLPKDFDPMPICEDCNFVDLYLIFWKDSHGTDTHFDYLGRQIPSNEIQKSLQKLEKVYIDWDLVVKKERYSDQLLEHLTVETRKHLAILKKDKRFKIDGIFYANYHYEYFKKQIILHSKFIHYKVREFFEKASVEKYAMVLWDKEIIFDKKSLIHILFGHFAPYFKNYQVKDYYDINIKPDEVINFIQFVIQEINRNIEKPYTFPENIYFQFAGKDYAIWFPRKELSSKSVRLKTCYPIGQKYEIERIANEYNKLPITKELTYYIPKT